jgi:DNA-binding beta-propeller fold protein YncE
MSRHDSKPSRRTILAATVVAGLWALGGTVPKAPAAEPHRYLYVAEPGIRNYLEYGGHGILVFDIDNGHRFLRRIKTSGIDPKTGQPENVKGVCASARTGRIYVTTIRTMTCLDLRTEKILWEREYEGGCDRMAIAPDGKAIYVPSFEKDHWNVVDADDGHVIAKIVTKSGSHNTVFGLDGKHVYLAGLRSPMLTIASTADHDAERTVGPFSASIRPFTVDGRQRHCFVNVNGLLGFEVGDLATGRKLYRVEVQGFEQGPVKRHGCPSHGIGMTPDEKALWVVDAFNQRLHIFDATVMPPKQVESLKVRDEPGWVTFTIDGRYAYPSTGEVIETSTRKVVAQLKDENGAPIMSEKMVEIDFDGDRPVQTGDQFGVGRFGSNQARGRPEPRSGQ